MNAAIARRILVMAAGAIGQTIDGLVLEPCAIVQAVEVVFATPVVYDRETGGLCPFCHVRGHITNTSDCGVAIKRYHKCPKCSRNFCSVEASSTFPEPIAVAPPRRHSRGRKRRS